VIYNATHPYPVSHEQIGKPIDMFGWRSCEEGFHANLMPV
jgi:hypothetical protein